MRHIGIDIGTAYLKACVIDEGRRVIKRWYLRHHSDPVSLLKKYIDEFLAERPEAFQITGTMVDVIKGIFSEVQPLDILRCNVLFVKRIRPDVRNIIDVGAGSLTYVSLNERGEVAGLSTNSLCAAGTGSFVDEQLSRLALDYEIIKSFKRVLSPPSIATRCAVFAKSDITHRQQEGYTKEESYSGLCKGLATTIYQTLIRGKSINGSVVVLGGLTLNSEVMYWLSELFKREVVVPEDAEIGGAMGAALISVEEGGYRIDILKNMVSKRVTGRHREERLRPPLLLRLSKYPENSILEFYEDERGNEVNLYGNIKGKQQRVYIGLDIGSTSTKCALVDENKRILMDVYRKTSGEPVMATRYIFRALRDVERRYNTTFEVLGFATTGSGRRLVGEVFGADLIINEITAHASGAISLFKDVRTIFEIGGQDSKYIRIEDGRVVDSNMNYVCAAGTGSFVEEQAKRLGFKISEVGDIVLGISPPYTSDRCTVFMEQDINRLLGSGYTREEVLAAIHYSIIQNYLTKVVGNRPVDKSRVVFMGATARNKGLVAAIENLLNVKVDVSPYCHINGAFGAANILIDRMARGKTASRFKGFEMLDKPVTIMKSECKLCTNHCQIFSVEDEEKKRIASWGYLCGREEDEKGMRHSPNYEPFEIRERIIRESLLPLNINYTHTIGIPRALSNYTYFPLFYNFFVLLGLKPVLSRRTSPEIAQMGSQVLTSEFCYPIKIAHGHIRYLLNTAKTDFVFAPDMISEERSGTTTNDLFCPYLSSFGSMVRSIMGMRGDDEDRLITLPFDLRMPLQKLAYIIYEAIKDKIGVKYEEVLDALGRAIEIQRGVERELSRKGQEIINSLKGDERGIVIVGRPYNSIDPDVNLSIPNKISALGFKVIPIDMVPLRLEYLKGRFENIYWEYGSRIISALHTVAMNKNLNAVYISNFKCGPDSFLLSFAEEIMGDKPLLILEMDEHGADAGYQTRIEAFAEVLRSERDNLVKKRVAAPSSDGLKDRVILIPPMHEITSRLFASAFRGEGYRAEALPEADYEGFNLGKGYTRGSECLPMIVTLGSLLKFLRTGKYKSDEITYFMPTATGPCRFGQYALLSEIALSRAGYEGVKILSPAAYNTYKGLSVNLRTNLWYAVLIGDILYKMAMKIRPYELKKGETDLLLVRYTRAFERAFERGIDVRDLLRDAVEDFKRIRIDRSLKKPLIGVMGEIYVRAEPFSNQNLIRFVEEAGGEAWLTPLAEWFHYVSEMRIYFISEGLRESNPISATKALLFKQFFRMTERELYEIASDVLSDRIEPDIEDTVDLGSKFVNRLFEGETIITIGRALEFIKSGASLIVNVAPFNCMPGTISSGVFERIQKEYGVCILNLFYDGEGDINRIIKTAISNISYQRDESKKDISIERVSMYKRREKFGVN